MKVYKPQWQCTLDVTEGVETTASWKHRLAWQLRHLADRLEGGKRTLTLDVDVRPGIPREDVDRCLGKGFALSQTLMTELAQHAACENIMRDAKAELYESD
ncbi:hypothetical protein ACSEE7_15005 [Halomonas cupida]|uniref:hypothetical protein n=1 Tax=Halomonas TaxID=2745 RepID=UPI001A8D40CC|nr:MULTISPECIES: hypothetical protein [Halomonas]MBN8411717.1 hypothetical protein [Halomonas litopenaei]MBY5927919.1 hypothetical protein [Halomonas sp. DP8Y7-3]MBY5983034.1 hypothetical protein [Halomonas sp. DP5Y7-2]